MTEPQPGPPSSSTRTNHPNNLNSMAAANNAAIDPANSNSSSTSFAPPPPDQEQQQEQHQQDQHIEPASYPPFAPAYAGAIGGTAPPPSTATATAATATDPTTALMLETAANAAAAHLPASAPANPTTGTITDSTSIGITNATEDANAVALAAMQEAATIVMEAQQREQLQQQQQQQQQQSKAFPTPTPPHPPQTYTYTYAAANAAYSPSISARSKTMSNRPLTENNFASSTTTTTTTTLPILATTTTTTTTTLNSSSISSSNHKKRTFSPKQNGDNHVDGDDEEGEETSSEPPSKKRPASTLRIPWDERLRQLQEYKEKHGDLFIPIRYKPSNLGKFVHNTREQFKLFHKRTPEGYKKKCSLTEARIEQLDALGFAWTTERSKRQNDDWQRRLQQLEEFKEKNGHCLVPHGYSEDPSFAEWIHRQRTSYNSFLKADEKGDEVAVEAAKAANPMMQARFQKLKDMGFNFTVHSDKWMDHWNQLKEYKEKHGDCQVPTHFQHNIKLGRWVHTQRHQRRLQAKGKKSCITQERIDLLDELGFSWEVRPSLERPRATWHQRCDELNDFYLKNGNFLVNPVDMPQLHAWCHEQKQRLKLLDKNNGKDITKRMNSERVHALQKLGFTKDVELLEAGATAAAGVGDDSSNLDTTEDNTNNAEIAEDAAAPAGKGDKPSKQEAPHENGRSAEGTLQETVSV